jgi:hypothetical protein
MPAKGRDLSPLSSSSGNMVGARETIQRALDAASNPD